MFSGETISVGAGYAGNLRFSRLRFRYPGKQTDRSGEGLGWVGLFQEREKRKRNGVVFSREKGICMRSRRGEMSGGRWLVVLRLVIDHRVNGVSWVWASSPVRSTPGSALFFLRAT